MAGKTSFVLRPMTVDDCLPIAQQRSRVFGNESRFVNSMWPLHWKSEGRKYMAKHLESTFLSNPAARFVVAEDPNVTDPGTGKPLIIGCAEWKVYAGNGQDPGELWSLDYLNEGGLLDQEDIEWQGKYASEQEARADRREMARFIIAKFFEQRKAAIMETPGRIWVLDVLAIEPSYQRKGVGTALVKWGLDQVDAEDLEAWVEGSVGGMPLYEKMGFKTIEQYKLDLPKKEWGESPKLGPWRQRRPAKSQKAA